MNPEDLEKLKNLGIGAFEQIKDMIDEDTINTVKDMIKDNPDMIKQARKLIASQMPSKQKKIQPNSKCPCESGKKYKKCCFGKPPPEQKREKAPRKPTYTE